MKTALTIAGTDPSGGAGIQADIKTMTANGVFATCAVTALVAQNTTGVKSIVECTPDFLAEELDCVFTDIFPDAVKTGMVSSIPLIRVIAAKLKEYGAKNLVVDPVMVATSGDRLITEDAVSALKELLLPLATVLTPNIPEAEILSGMTIRSAADMEAAARAISEQYGCGVYVVTVDDMADYIDPDAVTETDETGMAAFTEYAWDALGLAASYDSNGIMLALSMVERDFQMLAHGDTANAAFTDYGKYIMQDEFLDNFREDDWYGGFADYIAACGRYLEANANGAPIDVEPSDETEEEYEPLSFGDKLFFAALMAFRFGLPLGLIVAFIVCAIYKRQLKSVRRATEAARYTVSGGAEITAREDRFTHTTEVRTPIKTESDDHDSGPSFSGGTTVNSGGFSHSGGKF